MKKIFVLMLICSMVILPGCGESGITVTGDNATINTNAETNNAQAIVDTDVNSEVDIDNDNSTDTTTNTNTTTNNAAEVSVKDSDEYKQLLNENDQLKEQNNELSNRISQLENQNSDMPIIEYQDLALCINGENIPIDKNGSSVTIDGKVYYSKELAESFLDGNNEVTIQDGTLYIGKIISEKANLFDKHINEYSNCSFYDNQTDSYGNVRYNILYFGSGTSHNIIFVLGNEYSFLKFTISMSDNAYANRTGTIVVKADNNIVYTSDILNKQTEPFETPDIPINNCSLLTIEYNSESNNGCMISDAIVYN